VLTHLVFGHGSQGGGGRAIDDRPNIPSTGRGKLQKKGLPHDPPPFELAAGESRTERVPASRGATVSWPSRNTPCFERTRCEAASWPGNRTVVMRELAQGLC
jgi:hypothetical protein